MNKNAMNLIFPSIVALLIISASCAEGSQSRASSSSSSSIGLDIMSAGAGQLLRAMSAPNNNATTMTTDYDTPFLQMERFKQIQAAALQQVKDTAKDRKAKAREVIKKMPQPRQRDLERINPEEFDRMTRKQKERGLNWFGDGSSSGGVGSISAEVLVDPSQYYDKWAQAYRMLGGYIDCDHDKSDGDHHSNDNNNQQQNEDQTACSRWMIWASVSFLVWKSGRLFSRIEDAIP